MKLNLIKIKLLNKSILFVGSSSSGLLDEILSKTLKAFNLKYSINLKALKILESESSSLKSFIEAWSIISIIRANRQT